MKLKDKLNDNYLTGVIIALVIVPVSYFAAEGLRTIAVKIKGNPYLLPPPAAQLASLLVSIILFRIIIVNLEKEKIGKAYFFVVALTTFVYFFFFYKMRNQG